MFGYVRANKAELRIKEYETYKAVYCTLCKRLGREYGLFMRLTLSYDLTFVALLCLAQSEGCSPVRAGRCVVNPLKKCRFFDQSDQAFGFSAAAAVILLYYKLVDDAADERGIKRLLCRIAKTFIKPSHKKAARLFPELESAVSECRSEQAKAEAKPECSLDEAAEPSAVMLGKTAVMTGPPGSERALYRMGYCVGKWLYLIDAVDDYEKDVKSGRFNPFAGKADGAVKEYALPLLNNCFTEAAAAYNLLEIRRFGGILENIMFLGFKEVQKTVIKKEKNQ